jgi:hypothetical protein
MIKNVEIIEQENKLPRDGRVERSLNLFTDVGDISIKITVTMIMQQKLIGTICEGKKFGFVRPIRGGDNRRSINNCSPRTVSDVLDDF